MNNLKKAIKVQSKQQLVDFKETLSELNTIDEILSKWYLNQLIPSSSKRKKWNSTKELKNYLEARKIKAVNKSLEKSLNRIDTIKNSDDIKSITINVDWKKSRYYGNQAKAEIRVSFKDNTCKYFESSRTGGCGYDKESTAIAEALNQCNGLLKLLYRAKNKDVTKSNRELIGCGSGYGILPAFEGGVGVSCMNRITETIKCKFIHVSNGKAFDVYQLKR